MKDLFEKQVLDLRSSDIKELINRKVKIYLKRKDLEKQEYLGFIREIGLSSNEPHKPFDITLELENGSEMSFGIIGIKKIEFLK